MPTHRKPNQFSTNNNQQPEGSLFTSNKPGSLALQLSIQTVAAMRSMVSNIDKHDRDLARQIRRAMSSVALNLGEAEGSDAGNRRARLHTALGSARETRVGLQLASAWGYIAHEELAPIEQSLDRVCALTYGMLRR